MPFPPPTHGYEEEPLALTIEEHLVPDKASIQPYMATSELAIRSISRGDMVTIHLGRKPHPGCVALIEHHGEMSLVVLHYHHGRWFAQTDNHQGAVTKDMTLIGVGRALIKDQLQ